MVYKRREKTQFGIAVNIDCCVVPYIETKTRFGAMSAESVDKQRYRQYRQKSTPTAHSPQPTAHSPNRTVHPRNVLSGNVPNQPCRKTKISSSSCRAISLRFCLNMPTRGSHLKNESVDSLIAQSVPLFLYDIPGRWESQLRRSRQFKNAQVPLDHLVRVG